MRFATLLAIGCLPAVHNAASGDILVGCWQTNDVRRFGEDGTFKGIFITPGTSGLTTPDGLALDRDGNVLVSSAQQGAVLRFSPDGTPMGVFASENIGRAGYCAYGPDGKFYVCDSANNAVHRYNGVTGAFINTVVSAPGLSPVGVSWWNGQMLVSDFNSGLLRRFDATTGAPMGIINTAAQPLITRMGADGLLYVSEYGASRVGRYDPASGALLSSFNTGMNGPVGQLILSDGTLLIASWNSRRILHFNADGSATENPFIFAQFPAARPNDMLLLPEIPAPGTAAVFVALGAGALRRRR